MTFGVTRMQSNNNNTNEPITRSTSDNGVLVGLVWLQSVLKQVSALVQRDLHTAPESSYTTCL